MNAIERCVCCGEHDPDGPTDSDGNDWCRARADGAASQQVAGRA